MTVIAIDPGANTGWAIWEMGTLIKCGLGVSTLMDYLGDADPHNKYERWLGVYEHPEYQPTRRVNPNDIITLAVRAGIVIGRLGAHYGIGWRAVKPSEWKGSVPKKVHQARFVKTLTTQNLLMLEAELTNHAKTDDIIDAVALGYWYLRKLSCAR